MGQKIPDFPTTRWADALAPSLDDMELMAIDALKGLPEPFGSLAERVTIRMADFPEPEVLAELELESPFEILGLFYGEGLSDGGGTLETGRMDNAIWLYRRPILDYWAEHEETLGAVVRHVFIHELGHHFGLSDDDMDRIEASA